MLITDQDKVLTAKQAKQLADNNKDDSIDRSLLRNIMEDIAHYSSYGQTSTSMSLGHEVSKEVISYLENLGYKVKTNPRYPMGIYISWE